LSELASIKVVEFDVGLAFFGLHICISQCIGGSKLRCMKWIWGDVEPLRGSTGMGDGRGPGVAQLALLTPGYGVQSRWGLEEMAHELWPYCRLPRRAGLGFASPLTYVRGSEKAGAVARALGQ
jgi:hypothetical protein